MTRRMEQMRFSKDMTKYYGFGRVGRNAYTVSNVWKLGIHLFENDGCKIFRVCYLRTKKSTYYFQYEWGCNKADNKRC